MALTYDPFREMERLFSTAVGARGPQPMPIDLFRDGDHYVLSADLPGIDPGSVDIDVDGQQLTIRAERSVAAADGVKWLTRERSGGSFLRQFTLGQGLDTESIAATYDHGVLTITIPVSERAKPRRIEITSGASTQAIDA